MAESLTKNFKKMSTKKIVAVACVGSVALGATAFFVLRGIRRNKAEKDAKKRLSEYTDDAKQNAVVRRIDDAKAKSIAAALLDAMDGIGTDETEIYNILVMNNKLTSLDLIAVSEAFGVVEYGTFGKPWWGNGEPLDLIGWIKKELSNNSTEYMLIRAMFNQAGLNFD